MIKRLRITVEGKAYDVQIEVLGESGAVAAPAPTIAPTAVSAPVSSPVSAPLATAKPSIGASAAGSITSPLAGKVVAIHCAIGQAVALNQKVITLEAMKMNTEVSASQAGTIREILVRPGDGVEEGQPLLVLG